MILSFLTLSLSFFALATNAFLVALEGASTATAPVTVTGTFQRQTGDPSGITIRVVDISNPAGPSTLVTESPPESEQSGSFQVALTTPGVYTLQAGASAILVTSNTVTVSAGSTNVDSGANTDANIDVGANPISSITATSTSSSTIDFTTSTTITASTLSSADPSSSTTSRTSSGEVHQTTTAVKVSSLSSSPTPITSIDSNPPTSALSTTLIESPSSISSSPSPATPAESTDASSSSHPSVNPQNGSGSLSQRTGRVVGGVIGGFVILVLLLLFLLRFRHRNRPSIPQWLGSVPGASGVSRSFSRVIGHVRPHGHRGSLATRRRWYRISADSRLRESTLPFTRGAVGEEQDITDVSESGVVVRESSATSMIVNPQFVINGEMVEHPNHVPGTALYDFARIDPIAPMGVNPQSDINVRMAERPTHIPGVARYDFGRIDSGAGYRYSSSSTDRGELPWTPPPPFAVTMPKRMVTDMYLDNDPPPSYASHSPGGKRGLIKD